VLIAKHQGKTAAVHLIAADGTEPMVQNQIVQNQMVQNQMVQNQMIQINSGNGYATNSQSPTQMTKMQ